MSENMTPEAAENLIKKIFEKQIGMTMEELKKFQDDSSAKLAAEFAAHRKEFDSKRKHTDLPKGIRAARFCRSVLSGKNSKDGAISFAKHFDDDVLVKTLNESTFDSGGALIPEEFSADIIELLREDAAVLALGPQMVPMPGGNMSFRKINQGATAYWVGENEVITKSEQASGQVKLSTKTLGILVPVSNKLLRHARGSGFSADQIVLNDMIGAGSEALDLQLIRGNGTSSKPTGLRYLCDTSTNLLTATKAGSVSTLAEITADLGRMVQALLDAKVKIRRGGWIFAPRVYMHLFTICNSLGLRAFQAEMEQGKLFGFPFKANANIPVTGLDSTGQTEITFADFSRILVGEDGPMKVDTFDGGAYSVGGTVYSGISQDETVMRVLWDTDMGARHGGKEIAVLKNCEWGKV